MLDYNDVREGRYIVLDGAPYEVLTSHVFRKQQRKPVNATKLRNLLTGKVMEHSFAVSDKVAEAEISERPALYLYHLSSSRLPAGRQEEYWFCDPGDKSQRFKLTPAEVADKITFIKPGTEVKILTFDERVIGLKIPVKVELVVKEAPPNTRGNTAQGGSKKVVLETGALLTVPMFVETGDRIIVNTQTGEYVERAK